jgi:hypothetical protein
MFGLPKTTSTIKSGGGQERFNKICCVFYVESLQGNSKMREMERKCVAFS